MAFEIVVRPAIFPNIRPAQARPIAPGDDPTKGFCVIRGSSGQTMDLQFSSTVSSSQSRPREVERRSDSVRVYQMDDNGVVNRDNFVDIDVANRITMEEGGGGGSPGALPEGSASEQRVYYYRPIQEDLNIEITRRNKITGSGE